MHDGRAIANFVLDVCDESGRDLTHLSLQKIVYFCHAWTLAKKGEPLVKHSFEAWQYGPVLQYLYRDFKDSDSSPIRYRAKKLDASTGTRADVKYELDDETRDFLRKIIFFYSQLRPGTLVELSHAEGGPWHAVWNHTSGVNPGMTISNEEISKFYIKSIAPF